MSNFSKIVILIILVLSFFFIKEKTGFDFGGIFSSLKVPKIEISQNTEKENIVKTPTEIIKQEEELMFIFWRLTQTITEYIKK